MNKPLISASALALFLLTATSGCAHEPSADELTPALLSSANSSAVTQQISELLGNNKVSLADDVFTKQSSLVLTHPQVLDSNGNPIMGKDLTMPDRFMLLKDANNTCYLHHLNSDKLVSAPALTCQ